MAIVLKSKLPRLSREYYQGLAVVMWTHGIEQRTTGWLNQSVHSSFREVLLHACSRFAVVCPCYVLMPDHWHVVLMGLSEGSDQWLATAFLRKHLGPVLKPARLQDRAHDRVLREGERRQKSFQATCSYVCHNPQRAGLGADWRNWPYLGAVIAGYPDLDPRTEDFWEKYWKIYNRLVGGDHNPCAHAQGYKVSDPVARSVRSGTSGQ